MTAEDEEDVDEEEEEEEERAEPEWPSSRFGSSEAKGAEALEKFSAFLGVKGEGFEAAGGAELLGFGDGLLEAGGGVEAGFLNLNG